MATSTAAETRPMIACGVRRWINVIKATVISGREAPNTAALRQTTTRLCVQAMTRMPTTQAASPATQAATSPIRLITALDDRPPATAPTPCTETITATYVAGLSKASSSAYTDASVK